MDIHSKKTEDNVDIVETDDEGTEIPQVKKLKEKLQKCLEEKKEYLDGWQRMKADSINLKKEEEKKRKELAGFVTEDIFQQLLPVLDSFDLAFGNKESWEKVDANWRTGVEYIYSQLYAILKENGLEMIEPNGMPFDPRAHASVEIVDVSNEAADGIVTEVLQKGYRMKDGIIRPAKVKVGKYKKNQES